MIYDVNIYGLGLAKVTGIQFEPYGPSSLDPTPIPSGPPVPTIPLTNTSFELVNNQHIGVYTSVTDTLLVDGTLNYNTWYKAYLTYECEGQSKLRAITPNTGWNWDEAYAIAPNIQDYVILDRFNTLPASWATYGYNTYSSAPSPNGLILSAGPSLGSVSGIANAGVFAQGDWTIDFNIDRSTSSYTPDNTFVYACMEYSLPSDGSVIKISRTYNTDIGHAYVATINDTNETLSGAISTGEWSGSLRIIRFGASVTLLAKDASSDKWQTVSYTRKFSANVDGKLSVYCTNNNVLQISKVIINRYVSNPGLMFGDEPAIYTSVGSSYVDVLVQPQLDDTTRFVTIYVYTQDQVFGSLINGFEYVRPNKFSLGSSPSVALWIYRDVPTAPGIAHTNAQSLPNTRLFNTTLSPSVGSYAVGQSIQYKLIARFNDNTARDVTSEAEWTTSDPYGTITPMGLMTFGYVPSLYYVTATYQSITQTAAAYVTTTARIAHSSSFAYSSMARIACASWLNTTVMARQSQSAVLTSAL